MPLIAGTYAIPSRAGTMVVYKPTLYQHEFLALRERRSLVLAAMDMGLRTTLLVDAVDAAKAWKGQYILILVPDEDAMLDIHIRLTGIIRSAANVAPVVKALTPEQIKFANRSIIAVKLDLPRKTDVPPVDRLLVLGLDSIENLSRLKAEHIIEKAASTVRAKVGQVVLTMQRPQRRTVSRSLLLRTAQWAHRHYRLHTIPWWKEASHTVKTTGREFSSGALIDFFTDVEVTTGYDLTPMQREWYALQHETLGAKETRRRYVSFIEDALYGAEGGL